MTPEASCCHHSSAKSTGFLSLEWKFTIAALLSLPLALHMLVDIPFLHDPYVQLIISLPVFYIGLIHFGKSALNALKKGTTNMDVLIILGVTAAFVYSLIGTIFELGSDYHFYETATTIIAFVLLGNLLEKFAVKKTTSAVQALISLKPSTARRLLSNGITEEIDTSALCVGDLVLIHLGESVPTDSEVISGEAYIDESMVTGESVPVQKKIGSIVVGGTIVESGNITARVKAIGGDTVLSKIVSLVEEAQGRKPSLQKLGDKVSEVFVPTVIAISIITFIITSLVVGETTSESLLRAIAVLVIACPCAMGLATPAAVMVGLGNAARRGVLIKGGDTAELLSKIKRIVFDKTGTLTKGRFTLVKMKVIGNRDEITIKSAIRGLEEFSSHPIASSLREVFKDVSPLNYKNVNETKGVGIEGVTSTGDSWAIGGYDLVKDLDRPEEADLYLLFNNEVVATLYLEDTLKEDTASVIEKIHKLGIAVSIISGDKKEKCEAIGKTLGIDDVFSEKSPAEKVNTLRNISKNELTAFVGDGINDAPSLSAAAVGISFSNASDAAIQSAEVILLSDRLSRLFDAIITAKETDKTIKENLFWAFIYNIIAIPFAAAGFLTPIFAAFAMAFSDLFIIGNSLRRLSFPPRIPTVP